MIWFARLSAVSVILMMGACGTNATSANDVGAGGNSGFDAGGAGGTGTAAPFTLHVVDVGSGLGTFVEGPGFTLVFDAGSDDDSTAGGHANRFLDYLKAVRPDLKRIDHVILSHPHQDHVDLLPDIVAAYDIGEIWDSGVSSSLCSYQAFLVAVESKLKAINTATIYHSAANAAGLHDIALPQPCEDRGSVVTLDRNQRSSVQLLHGAQIATGSSVTLGERTKLTFLYANGVSGNAGDPNYNTLVVSIDGDGKRVLLAGDANDTVNPNAPAGTLSVEEQLLQLPGNAIAADVLVAGYHGYSGVKTGFIAAVKPSIAIVPSYPLYAAPLPEVLAALAQNGGQVFRTDVDDDACGKSTTKIGTRNDGRPGGCSNLELSIANGSLAAVYFP
jgi:competence protein ComEC